jgi:hypothetical protein
MDHFFLYESIDYTEYPEEAAGSVIRFRVAGGCRGGKRQSKCLSFYIGPKTNCAGY